MITQITIKNFGLIDDLSLEFCPSLNIFTGETGAGKSIIIDALRFCLGETLNSAQVRDPGLPASVEAVFEIKDEELRGHADLEEFFSGDDGGLIVSRTHFPDGKKRIKINGFSVTIAQLKRVGDLLVDFHGANDHQMLLADQTHRQMLDRLADFGTLKEEYRQRYDEYARLKAQRAALETARSSRERDLDLVMHQVKELEQVPLESARYEELVQSQLRLNNAQRLYEACSQILDILENEEGGLSSSLQKAFVPLKALTKIDGSTERFWQSLNGLQENSQQIVGELREYLDGLSFDQATADQINRTCDTYDDILRKYGPSMDDASAFYQEAKRKYDLLSNLEENDQELREQLSRQEKLLAQAAKKVTAERKKTSVALQKTIEAELSDLGFSHVQFECRFELEDFTAQGQDRVIFYISPNAGEALKPLADIVSSGEAARLMLALKKALTAVDPVPVLIFDEIDAQIGGRLGSVVGRKLQEIACARQVVLITHLPQIASYAHRHFKVSKHVEGGRTRTVAVVLDEAQRVTEMAKMMSGEKETKISLTHAQDMRDKARKGRAH